jgi:2-keto-3-deoxy-L-rhamnonate aldolase RhmA
MDRCRDTGVPFGMYAASGAEAMDLLRREAQIVTVGSDLIFLERGLAQATETLRSVRGWKLDAIDETQEVGRA